MLSSLFTLSTEMNKPEMIRISYQLFMIPVHFISIFISVCHIFGVIAAKQKSQHTVYYY